MTKVLLDMLKESENASIINIGSVTGLYMGLRNQCAYNVCKALIHNMTRGMAIEQLLKQVLRNKRLGEP